MISGWIVRNNGIMLSKIIKSAKNTYIGYKREKRSTCPSFCSASAALPAGKDGASLRQHCVLAAAWAQCYFGKTAGEYGGAR